ncbi:DNA-methyltransferase [Vibrio barjaei]|uniref:DNA-methyltransferase n=1 Tax=Vibrio barjaei TaxID=1676683 RepID=UPI0022840865|nr:site-specific DNA-methyltransferase [Vibrio barjaei]MCY9870404.1 site-specific DNA-methyltransferase [Vibrio barjaei]
MNNIKLLHGDCLERLSELEENSVDLIVADMPYGTTNCKWDSLLDLDVLWPLLSRVAKPNAAIALFAQTPFDKALAMSNIKDFRYEWIWVKNTATNHLNAKRQPLKACEHILVFYKKQPLYVPQKTKGHKLKKTIRRNDHSDCYGPQNGVTEYESTERYPQNVIQFDTDRYKNNLHPTQKPVKLLEYLIKTYSKEGQTVLDFCMGSGSTGEAAVNLNRHFIGIEKDDHYFEVSTKRIHGCQGLKGLSARHKIINQT